MVRRIDRGAKDLEGQKPPDPRHPDVPPPVDLATRRGGPRRPGRRGRPAATPNDAKNDAKQKRSAG
jgi:hypothetical protein